MTALSGAPPSRGVRYTFALIEQDGDRARYDVAVETRDVRGAARVCIEGTTCRVEGEARDVDSAHLTQLLALAKTIAKRDDAGPWPRRVERWRAPGVR